MTKRTREDQPVNFEEEYETKYVKDVYNMISMHFNKTRYKAWPKIQEFTNTFTPNSLIADVGCEMVKL